MPTTITPSGRIGLCIRMRRLPVRFIRPESFVHTRSSAGFTITTSGFKFSVHSILLQTVSRLLPELPLFLMTAVATHLVMSFAQTLMHYKLGHHPMGGKFFRNHIN